MQHKLKSTRKFPLKIWLSQSETFVPYVCVSVFSICFIHLMFGIYSFDNCLCQTDCFVSISNKCFLYNISLACIFQRTCSNVGRISMQNKTNIRRYSFTYLAIPNCTPKYISIYIYIDLYSYVEMYWDDRDAFTQ